MPRKKLTATNVDTTITGRRRTTRASQMADVSADDLSVQAQSRSITTAGRRRRTSQTSNRPVGTDVPDGSSNGLERSTALHPLVSQRKEQAIMRERDRIKRQRKLDRNERDRVAYELLKAGATYTTIARECGFKTSQSAHAAMRRYTSRMQQTETLEMKALQLERLNHMFMVLWPEVNKGNRSAINTALSVWDRITAITDILNPAKIDVTHHGLPDHNVLVIGGSPDEYKAAMQRMIDRDTDLDEQAITMNESDMIDTHARATGVLEQGGGVSPGLPVIFETHGGVDSTGHQTVEPIVDVPGGTELPGGFPRIASDLSDVPVSTAPTPHPHATPQQIQGPVDGVAEMMDRLARKHGHTPDDGVPLTEDQLQDAVSRIIPD